jgi:hypothetical protein
MKPHRIAALAAILLAASLACSLGQVATPAPEGPTITLTNPLPGQESPVGEPVQVVSTSEDADGIQRVELWVDNTKVRVDSNPDLSSPYIVSQPWESEIPGTHVIVVKALDAQGVTGQSQPVVITLKMEALSSPESTSLVEVASTSTPEETTLVPTRTAPPSPSVTWTPTSTPVTPTGAPSVMCTPPPCQAGEVYYCAGSCPGGCDTQCATPTPTLTPPHFDPTGIDTSSTFKPVWEQPEVKTYLGYPIDEPSEDRRYARQYFERGYLYWWDNPDAQGLIWAVEIPQPAADNGDHWTGPYEDLWEDGNDAYSCDAARNNPNGPIRGFGKLWCENSEVAEGIGNASESEQGTGDTSSYGVVQFFQGGVMLFSPLDREVWVLFDAGYWQRHPR